MEEISTSKFFQRLKKLHEPVGRVQFVVFEKIYSCLFIPNCTRKIILLPVNDIHEKISPCMLIDEKNSRWLSRRNARNQGKLRHELRRPGRALDLKTKDLIGHL